MYQKIAKPLGKNITGEHRLRAGMAIQSSDNLEGKARKSLEEVEGCSVEKTDSIY